jgi:hypothetical protein
MFSRDGVSIVMTVLAVMLISFAVVLGKDINNPKDKARRSSKITGVVFLSISGIIYTLIAVFGWYLDITNKSGLFAKR